MAWIFAKGGSLVALLCMTCRKSAPYKGYRLLLAVLACHLAVSDFDSPEAHTKFDDDIGTGASQPDETSSTSSATSGNVSSLLPR